MPRCLRASVLAGCAVLSGIDVLAVAADGPRSVDPRIRIELYAEQPQIKTPTGIDVDARGRVWGIESNTHFRPEGYDGHPSDRLLVMEDTDGDGRADDVRVFADGFTHAMSVAVRPVWMEVVRVEGRGLRAKGEETDANAANPSALDPQPLAPLQVFVATRREILLLEDTDGDDVCDRRTVLARLETAGNYPHNGLAGFAFDALGWMYFGFGENLGEDYELWSREATEAKGQGLRAKGQEGNDVSDPLALDLQPLALSGGGEGGNIYRMRPDGTELSHWATGFWNPHASCVDAFGRLFTVDNDPDSRPPCRLLHVIEGGDYGYKFRNGRKGQHPFTAWNGEIPGTLPMVAGTGEAPSGIVAYEHDAFPEEYLGNLLVTSWGDHRIDRFRLQPRGASFESIAEPLIVGGEDFRPVGLALAPDGSLYCTDWVKRDYNLHGHGRVWRILAIGQEENSRRDAEAAEEAVLAGVLNEGRVGVLRQHVRSNSLSLRRAAARRLAAVQANASVGVCRDETASVRAKYECLMALAGLGEGDHRRVLKSYVPDRDGPYDAVQTGMALYFDESPSLTGLQRIIDEKGADDPLFLLAGLQNATPLLRVLGNSQSAAAAQVLDRLLASSDPFLFSEVVRLMSETIPAEQLSAIVVSDVAMSDELRMAALLAARRVRPDDGSIVEAALLRPSPGLRRLAVQWGAEQGMTDLRPQVEGVLTSEPMTTELFLATIAALDMLDGRSAREFEQAPIGKYVVPLLTNADTPDGVKVQALRLVEADDPELTIDVWRALLASKDFDVRLETVRSLCESPLEVATELLIEVATVRGWWTGNATPPVPPPVGSAEQQAYVLACEAMLGLAGAANREPSNPAAVATLEGLLRSDLEMKAEAVRALRTLVPMNGAVRSRVLAHTGYRAPGTALWAEIEEQLWLALPADHPERERLTEVVARRPESLDAWRELMAASTDGHALPDGQGVPPGDRQGLPRGDDQVLGGPVERGRLVFYHPNGPGCFKCHTVEGRGGRVGPDLSYVGRSFTREKLIDSILEPSKEVSPQFTTWSMLTSDGVVHTGMIVHENEGRTILGDSEGRTTEISTYDVQERVPQRVSVMPEKLWERMTVQEFRDLLAYLESLGRPADRDADDAD